MSCIIEGTTIQRILCGKSANQYTDISRIVRGNTDGTATELWTSVQPVEYAGLKFTANTAGATISLSKVGTPPEVTLKTLKSTDTEWKPFTAGETTITLDNVGDYVYFMAGADGNSGFASDTSNFHKFGIRGRISASGNIQSLLDASMTRNSVSPYCYCNLFYDCETLTTAPDLPAITLAEYCYTCMFRNCDQITDAPSLRSTTLAPYCYSKMFSWCDNLTTAPALPATTLANGCYCEMFSHCYSLTAAPELLATALVVDCYSKMFYYCRRLRYVKTKQTSFLGCDDWLSEVWKGGLFECSSNLEIGTAGGSTVPTGWSVEVIDDVYQGLKFTSVEGGSVISMTTEGTPPNVELQTSRDGINWSDFVVGTSEIVLQNEGDYVYFKSGPNGNLAFGDSGYNWNQFVIDGKVNASGDIRSLLDASLESQGVSSFCFLGLFWECSGLLKAPHLKSYSMSESCYSYMFVGCGLTETPQILATAQDMGSCSGMFYGCKDLTTAFALCDCGNILTYCYHNMFRECTSLNSITADFSAFGGCTDWLQDASSTGVFYCPTPLADRLLDGSISRDISTVPSEWTVVGLGY